MSQPHHFSVNGRSLAGAARSQNPLAHPFNQTPASPLGMPISPPPFAPSSPSSSASPFHSSHPSSPVSRFNQGSMFSISQANASVVPPTTSTAGGKFQVIQRPLASRVPAHGGGVAAFQHSLHPTAVQASHTVGHKAPSVQQQGDNKEKLPSNNQVGPQRSSAQSAKRASGPNKDWYGTFPRLGSAAAATAGQRGQSPALMTDISASLPPASPGIRASPSQGRSPEPSLSAQASPSTLHPRPKTGIAMKGLRTPPSRGGSRNAKGNHSAAVSRRNSDQSVDVGELQGTLQDMDLTADETPNSGYNSDASAISMDSHASSFPADHTYGVYGAFSTDPSDPAGFESVDAELADVSDVPLYARGGFPPSPMQLRAGAPFPNKMYGLASGAATPQLTSKLAGGGSGTNSVRSGSRAGSGGPAGTGGAESGGGSGEGSALQSPHMDAVTLHQQAKQALLVGQAIQGVFPMSPIPPIESAAAQEKLGVGVLLFPTTSGAQGAPGPVASPLQEFTTVPALNLPRSVGLSGTTGVVALSSPRSPTGGVVELLPSPHKIIPVVGTSDLAQSGSSSAFSSARSSLGMFHSTSASSVGFNSTTSSSCGSGGEDGMDWQSTPTARSLTSNQSSNSSTQR